jgi:N-hydroxyarylamine O-acetyltransferase
MGNHYDIQPNIHDYLKRIGYGGKIDATIATLSELQERHLHTVPYENLDIINGIPLSLDVPDIFDKVVVRHRGGYCFELNELFAWLLREIGFQVTDYFARFWRDELNTPPKRRHHVMKVEAEGRAFLCDVGVGGIVPRRPVEMVEGVVHEQDGEFYMLEQDSSFGWFLCERKKGEWHKIFSFSEEPQLSKDYVMASYWCQNAPESPFTKNAMAAIRTDEGRNSLSGREFRIFTKEGVRVFVPQTEDEYNGALKRYFGIVLG